MKNIYPLLFLLFTISASAQIPGNYYDGITTETGFTLKTALKNLIDNHSTRSYNQLYDGAGISGSQGYLDTHTDNVVEPGYENDNSILDMYSENPNGTDPYNYTHGNMQCGNQNSEGDCYNREHIIPQSSFGSNFPMQSDIHHVIPTDGRVNNFRGNLPFGNVASQNWTSLNGSQRGSSAMAGYTGTVFEPIDEFKGDIARALLYFATRYENTVDGYTSFAMFNGTEDQVFFPWAIDVLLDWHNNVDPVDQRERDRNDEAYNFQGNANPFVDHPEYADLIWNPVSDTENPTAPTNLIASNPTDNTIDLTWTASTDNIAVTSYDIYVDNVNTYNTSATFFTATGLTANTNYCFTVKALDAAGNESGFSNQDCEMTTNNGSGSSTCASETFENIPANSGSYSVRAWTGDNGLTWNATDARTDQTLNSRAITIRNGNMTSPTTTGGIGSLTVTTQLVFTGSAGTFDVKVNGNSVGSIPYDTTPQTTTINNINIEDNVTVVFDTNSSTSNRVRFDDLSWTCYTSLSTDDFHLQSVKIYPNPVNGDEVTILSNQDISVEVYDILGKKVKVQNISSNQNKLNISGLSKGVYLVKLNSSTGTITKKFIKQ
ncbi:endonuclease I [Flavobacteriales bacterium 33_180_T64]|nr:endonuclease I [Flavobacteriales bacterium 33_180_T64]